MTAKEYLSQAYRLNERIKAEQQEVQCYKDLSTSISGCGFEENSQSTRSTEPRFVKYSNKIVDIEREIERDKNDLVEVKCLIGNQIEKLGLPSERLVLNYRYLMFMSWDDVSRKMNYSKRWVMRIHDRAVFNLEKIMEGEGNGI